MSNNNFIANMDVPASVVILLNDDGVSSNNYEHEDGQISWNDIEIRADDPNLEAVIREAGEIVGFRYPSTEDISDETIAKLLYVKQLAEKIGYEELTVDLEQDITEEINKTAKAVIENIEKDGDMYEYPQNEHYAMAALSKDAVINMYRNTIELVAADTYERLSRLEAAGMNQDHAGGRRQNLYARREAQDAIKNLVTAAKSGAWFVNEVIAAKKENGMYKDAFEIDEAYGFGPRSQFLSQNGLVEDFYNADLGKSIESAKYWTSKIYREAAGIEKDAMKEMEAAHDNIDISLNKYLEPAREDSIPISVPLPKAMIETKQARLLELVTVNCSMHEENNHNNFIPDHPEGDLANIISSITQEDIARTLVNDIYHVQEKLFGTDFHDLADSQGLRGYVCLAEKENDAKEILQGLSYLTELYDKIEETESQGSLPLNPDEVLQCIAYSIDGADEGRTPVVSLTRGGRILNPVDIYNDIPNRVPYAETFTPEIQGWADKNLKNRDFYTCTFEDALVQAYYGTRDSDGEIYLKEDDVAMYFPAHFAEITEQEALYDELLETQVGQEDRAASLVQGKNITIQEHEEGHANDAQAHNEQTQGLAFGEDDGPGDDDSDIR